LRATRLKLSVFIAHLTGIDYTVSMASTTTTVSIRSVILIVSS